jgi:hypothetical protein
MTEVEEGTPVFKPREEAEKIRCHCSGCGAIILLTQKEFLYDPLSYCKERCHGQYEQVRDEIP